jgi:hypothetical protein
MDSNKNIIWQKNIYGTDAIGIENLTKLSNNNYLGSGGVNYGWSTGCNDFYAVLIKFDNAGNIIKSKTYDKTLKQTEFWNSIENSDGTIISAGNIYDTMPGNHEADGYIVKLDSALDTIWTQTVKMDDTLGFVDYFFNIFRSHDGGFVCTGMRNGPIANNTDGWVIKFDSLGCPIANCWLGSNENIDVNEAPLLVYPNPTEHGCIVRYPHHGPLLVDVYDNAGRKIKNVRTWPFGNTEYYVDLHNAPSGILLLRINYGNNVISTKIIKK